MGYNSWNNPEAPPRLMAINLDKPHLWKADIAQSVDMYNDWFVNFAPVTFRASRVKAEDLIDFGL